MNTTKNISEQVEQLRTAALNYAQKGWHVFPIKPDSKRPATPKHTAHSCNRTDPKCRHGHTGWEQRATTNQKRITQAWNTAFANNQPFGIGIACGPSNLLVVDLDTPKQHEARNGFKPGATGIAQLAELSNERELPETYAVRTPSGGWHLYYTNPPDRPLPSTAGKLGSLIDTRGAGGYVVAPPTIIDSGRYQTISNTKPAPLPGWLVKELSTRIETRPQPTATDTPQQVSRTGRRSDDARVDAYVKAAIRAETRHITQAGLGQRNAELFNASAALGQLVGAGHLNQHQTETALLEAAQVHVDATAHLTASDPHKFTVNEAKRTINSGINTGKQKPRHIKPQTTKQTVAA